MRIYYCTRRKEKKTDGKTVFYPDSGALLRMAALRYAMAKGRTDWIERLPEAVLFRKIGKPFFEGISGLFTSISHTGEYWICACGCSQIGIDVEFCGRMDTGLGHYLRIAERFFSEEEQEYVTRVGARGFLEVWTGKEALGKYHETGLIEREMQRTSVIRSEQNAEKRPWVIEYPDLGREKIVALCMDRNETIESVEELQWGKEDAG